MRDLVTVPPPDTAAAAGLLTIATVLALGSSAEPAQCGVTRYLDRAAGDTGGWSSAVND